MLHIQHSFPNAKKMARHYGKLAVRALYDEVALYPKPGLVSFIDQGAHQDMDGALFFRSLFGLRHYFFQVSLLSAHNAQKKQLVHLGQEAEHTMQRITGGVNTHRGAIFALGIMCSTLSRLSMHYQRFSLDDFHHAIIEQWATYLQKQHQNNDTHGAWVKQKYAVADAKQMAIEGYKLVFDTYLALQDTLHDKVFFGLLAYQRFLLQLDDINILYRTGREGLDFARQHIALTINEEAREHTLQDALRVHHLFSQKNISPGGVADMLGLVYFLHHLFAGKQQ